MKKIIIVISLIVVTCAATFAQVSFGLKGGANFATISNYDDINVPQTVTDAFTSNGSSAYRTGFHAGLLMCYMTGNGLLAIQPELLYSNQGMKNTGTIAGISGTKVESTIKTDYINLPVMVQVHFIPRVLYAEAGPQLGFRVNSSAHFKGEVGGFSYEEDWDIGDDLNTFDFSLAFGVGFQLPKLPLGIHARYSIGLTEVEKNANSDNDKTYNGVFQVGLFFRFGQNDNQ